MFAHSLRSWPSIKPLLVQRFKFDILHVVLSQQNRGVRLLNDGLMLTNHMTRWTNMKLVLG